MIVICLLMDAGFVVIEGGGYDLTIEDVTLTFFRTKEGARAYLRQKLDRYQANHGGDPRVRSEVTEYLTNPRDSFYMYGSTSEIRPIVYSGDEVGK